MPRSCLDDDPDQTPATTHVPLLSSVGLPDGSTYSMPAYNLTAPGAPCHGTGTPDQALLTKLVLPTLGAIEYVYWPYEFPVYVEGQEANDPLWLQRTAGVHTRTLRDRATSNNALGIWTYTQELPGGQSARKSITHVVGPLGDKTDYYFDVSNTNDVYAGLPFSPLAEDEYSGDSSFHLSSEVFDCDAGGTSCISKRRKYVHYDADFSSTYAEVNPRLSKEKVIYVDDASRHATVTRSDWDGFGHYRTEDLTGSFGSGNNKTTTVDWNPQYRNVAVPAAGAPWVLDTYDYRETTVAGVSERSDFCYDESTGFLKRERVRTVASGTATTDLVTELAPDAHGNVAAERHYGGDASLQAAPHLGTGPDLCTVALGAAQYRRTWTNPYQDAQGTWHRQLRAEALDGTGNGIGFFDPDVEIDQSTGLVTKTLDTAGLATSLSYDVMGRLVLETPAELGKTQYAFVNAVGSTPAKLTVTHDLDGASPAQERYSFDGLGRLTKEEKLGSTGTWNARATTYNGTGSVATVSAWGAVAADSHLTSFSDYDPFGRARTITGVDGKATTMAFTGDRVVTRTVKIRLPSAETNVPTTEIYDRQGRLASVTEPSGINGANVTTTYGYDLASRLVSVAAGGDQDRSWHYDGRGLLTSQTSAEAATVSYDRYDSRGHAHHRNDGLHQLAFDFDPAERLIDVKRDATGELLKQFVFGNGTTNLGGDRAKGRLFQASRFNYTRIAVGKIIQTYEYGSEGKQGAVSKLTTDFYIGAQHSNTFEQSYTWSSFGKIDTTTLPKQTGAAGPAGEQPSTTRSYTRGWLTRVNGSNGNYINNVTYHPNGAWSSITHANLVRDDQTLLDATRPRSFKATGSGLSWASGVYAYDGAGNITGIGGDTSFRYDRVSRLVSADVLVEGLAGNVIFSDGFESGDTSCWGAASCSASGDVVSQSFTYDNYGNLTGIAGEVGGLALTTDINNNHLDAASYDAAGQVTAWNGHTYDYDDLGMLLEYDRNSSTDDWLYLYDANDERILNFKIVDQHAYNRWTLRDLDGSVLRQFLYERDDCPDPPQCSDPPVSSWTVERDYLHAGGMLLGARRYDGNGVLETYHFHLDHLGSPRLITNAAGAELSRHTYMPFGLEVSPPDFSERMKFTGHEWDIHEDDSIATDLDYMRARHYNPQLGRFLSPDPSRESADPKSPQSFNRYAYVVNNPVRYTDPSGMLIAGSAVPTADKGWTDCSGLWGCISHAVSILARSDRYGLLAFGNPLSVVGISAKAANGAKTIVGLSKTVELGQNAGRVLTAGARIANAAGRVVSFVTSEDGVFYRVFSGDNRVGAFLTRVRPRSAALAREALDLPPGNSAEFVQEVLVPAGTRLQRSRVLGGAFGGQGGAEQFELLQYVPIENFGPGVPLP